jgi:hypothetical protein
MLAKSGQIANNRAGNARRRVGPQHAADFDFRAYTERDCFNLIDTQIGDTITEGDLALEPDTFPRYTLVRQKTMLRAAKTFFERGQRDPGCEWVPARDTFDECAGEVAQQRAAR